MNVASAQSLNHLSHGKKYRLTTALLPLLAGIAAFLFAVSRINHSLVGSSLAEGPGLTSDEPLYVSLGIYLFESFADHGITFFTPSAAREVFGADGYLPDHPPLGRMVLGAFHQFCSLIPGIDSGSVFNIPAARIGSCFLLGLTVFAICRHSLKQYGTSAAISSVVVLMAMPRVIGHARLATLETITMFTWTIALLSLSKWWARSSPPSAKQAFVSGIAFGFLLLTKMQAVFLPPLLVIWALWWFRFRAIKPLAIWGGTGFVFFFLGWPWLWLDPWDHLMEYFARSTERPTLYVWYWGQRYADKAVPISYPLVTFLLTAPVAAPLLIIWKSFAKKLPWTRSETLLVWSMVWPIVVFSIPGTPVYDGSRLFLIIMPACAIISGRGLDLVVQSVRDHLMSPASQSNSLRSLAPQFLILLCAVTSIAYSICQCGPFSLDSYNLIGRLVQRQNPDSPLFEASYWTDSLNGKFWQQVPEDSTVFVAPVSHQFQLRDMEMLIPEISKRRISLVAFEYDASRQRGLLLTCHRLADLRPALRQPPEQSRVLIEVNHQGMTLARLLDTTNSSWIAVPDWPSEESASD